MQGTLGRQRHLERACGAQHTGFGANYHETAGDGNCSPARSGAPPVDRYTGACLVSSAQAQAQQHTRHPVLALRIITRRQLAAVAPHLPDEVSCQEAAVGPTHDRYAGGIHVTQLGDSVDGSDDVAHVLHE